MRSARAVAVARRGARGGWRRWLTSLGLTLSACASPSADSNTPGPVTHALDPSAPAGAGVAPAAEFLDAYVANHSVVQLGESIHVTEEFPRVRLQLVQRLHERNGFDVLAFEGTAIGSWLAQEQLYRTEESVDARARRAQQLAWFGLWQTEPMLDVMRYVASTVGTPTPLYLASFDIQPGIGRAFDGSGSRALSALFEAVGGYLPPADPSEPARWLDAIAPLLRLTRSESRAPDERQVAERAIREMEAWLSRASQSVGRLRGEHHALALRQIPASLRATLELSWRVQGASLRTFQETRDALNAERAIQLRDSVSQTHKVMLWAHHSHTNYNVTGSAPVSMGQHLRERLGDQVYSIGVFAGEGHAVEIREGSSIEVVPRRIPPACDFGFEGLLSSARAGSYFVDLTALRTQGAAFAAWLEPQSARFEVFARTQLVPARDFDAAVFVREIHATRLLMLSPNLDRLLHLYGWLLDNVLAISVACSGLVVLVVRRWRRRRKATGNV